MPEYRIKPGGMHQRFQQSLKKIQVVGGGFGNGKTAGGCVKAIRLAKDYPGSNGIIAMATYAQLNDTIREEFFKWVPSSSVQRWPTLADNTLIFKNGSKVNFRYLHIILYFRIIIYCIFYRFVYSNKFFNYTLACS